jgi:lipid-A-disaccharide synthase
MTEITDNKSFMIIAGEISGDMHAANIIRAMQKKRPNDIFFGIGGPAMRDTGVETIYDVKDMAVMGIVEVLKHFKFFKKVFHEMEDLAYHRKPDAIILVDYPGFNLRFAAKAHAMGIKVIYYICPQVWAWHRERIPKMAAIVDKLITIFPFEAEHFNGTNLDVSFAGHPLVDVAKKLLATPQAVLPWKNNSGIALLPGSRRTEIERILPVMWKAAGLLSKENPDLEFIIAAPSERQVQIIKNTIKTCGNGPAKHHIVIDNTRQVLRQARAALVASGTATVETALMSCPMVITYKVAPLTYLMGKLLIKIKHIGMVNIIADKLICPELVQHQATPTAIVEAVTPLITDTPQRQQMIKDLQAVTEKLGNGGASQNAAQLILEVVENNK